MAWLKHRGYHVLSLESFLRYRDEHQLPPARSVVITFDDGYADNYEYALPVLRHYRVPATVFLVSDAVGTANNWDRDGELAGRPLLTWPSIREMWCDGISFGAHTRSHPRLTEKPMEGMGEEIAGSRADLQRILDEPICTFAYPYGARNHIVEGLVKQTGFMGAVGIRPGLNGPATQQYALRRTEIQGRDSLLRFALALWLGITHLTVSGRVRR